MSEGLEEITVLMRSARDAIVFPVAGVIYALMPKFFREGDNLDSIVSRVPPYEKGNPDVGLRVIPVESFNRMADNKFENAFRFDVPKSSRNNFVLYSIGASGRIRYAEMFKTREEAIDAIEETEKRFVPLGQEVL